MDALILSCSTGGGHNSAAYAVKEAFERRGHRATVLDPYRLVGHDLDRIVGNGYIRIAQRTPHLFGAIYRLGDAYRRLPIHSPVYAVNIAMRRKLAEYLDRNSFDVIFTTHVYPGEMVAAMKNAGMALPKCIFVATDYVCVPFTEETECDYFITPGPQLNADFIRHGISADRLLPFGIPVRQAFSEKITQDTAKERLGFCDDRKYILLSGGSIGAGLIEKTLDIMSAYMDDNADTNAVVICGSNKQLYEKTVKKYGGDRRFNIIGTTDGMALFMKACDAFISKPGGLSSTEAAVSNTPLIHISPIPGCENKNMDYFAERGMSVAVGDRIDQLPQALQKLGDPSVAEKMRLCQSKYINGSAADDICRFAEGLITAEPSRK